MLIPSKHGDVGPASANDVGPTSRSDVGPTSLADVGPTSDRRRADVLTSARRRRVYWGLTLFKKPGGDWIWVRLLVWTVGQDLVDFGFWGKGEDREIKGVAGGEGEYGDDVVIKTVARERKTEFG